MNRTPSQFDGVIIGENGFPIGIKTVQGYYDADGNYAFNLSVRGPLKKRTNSTDEKTK